MSILQSYGWSGLPRLAADLVRTRIFFPRCRLIRFPIFMRGRAWIDLGSRFSTGRSLRIEAFGDNTTRAPLIRFGSDVRLNDYVHIGAVKSVSIGNRVLMASHVFISDHNHGAYSGVGAHSDPRVPPNDRPLSSAAVVIEDDVWIGESVAILPGVTIGRGSVIGALTTVTKDIPPYSLAAGSPAKVIKRFNTETLRWESV